MFSGRKDYTDSENQTKTKRQDMDPNSPLTQQDIENSASATPPPQPAPQPQQTPPPPQPIAEAPGSAPVSPLQPLGENPGQPQDGRAKSVKKIGSISPVKVAIVAGVFLAVLAVGGILAATLTSTKKPVEQSAVDQEDKEEVKAPLQPLTAEKAFSHLQAYFKGDAPARTSLSTPIKTEDHGFYTVVTDPAEVVNTSAGGEVPAHEGDRYLEAARKSLAADEFTERILTDGTGGTNFLADYLRPDVTCQLLLVKPQDPQADQYFEMKCLDQKQYEELARLQQPFFFAYSSAQAVSAESALMGKATVTSSNTAGYQLAEMTVNTVYEGYRVEPGVVAKYYAGADNIWKFFTDASGVLPCALYNKDSAFRRAYEGLKCTTSNNREDTVTDKRR